MESGFNKSVSKQATQTLPESKRWMIWALFVISGVSFNANLSEILRDKNKYWVYLDIVLAENKCVKIRIN